MHRLVVMLLVMSSCASTPKKEEGHAERATNRGWYLLSPADRDFAIELPGEPSVHGPEDSTQLMQWLYSSEEPAVALVIASSVISVPVAESDHEYLIGVAVEAMKNDERMQVEGERTIIWHDVMGRELDVRMTSDVGTMPGRVRVFLDEGRYTQLLFFWSDARGKEQVERVFASFRFLSSSGKPSAPDPGTSSGDP